MIELIIVTAVSVILLGALFVVNFRITGLWSGERARSQMQQNLRFAADHITTKVRQAVSMVEPSVEGSSTKNVMSDCLAFDYIPDPVDHPDVRIRLTYSRLGTGPYYINERSQDLVQSGPDWVVTGDPTDHPITEGIRGLAATHFVRTGPLVVVVLVAQYELLGSTKTISYTTQTYVRTPSES